MTEEQSVAGSVATRRDVLIGGAGLVSGAAFLASAPAGAAAAPPATNREVILADSTGKRSKVWLQRVRGEALKAEGGSARP